MGVKLLKWSLIAIVLFAGFSCDEEETKPKIELQTITINAKSYSTWVYFSFDKDTVVQITDFANSTEWDLGFIRNHVRTNSGKSGKGKGGVVEAGAVSFESLKEAQADGYVVDDSIGISDPADPTHANMIKTPGSAVLEGWGTMNTNVMPPVFTPSNKIYFIKTAAGKYAKVWFKSYYSAEGASGYITLNYIYLSDGSKSFE